MELTTLNKIYPTAIIFQLKYLNTVSHEILKIQKCIDHIQALLPPSMGSNK